MVTNPANTFPAAPPTRLPRAVVSVVVLAVFLWLDHFHLDLFRMVAGDSTGSARVVALGLLAYAPQLAVAWGVAALLTDPRNAAAVLGLRGRPLQAFALALLLTLPMPMVLAWHTPPILSGDTASALWRLAVLPGFGEEVLYRGLLFGLLFRCAGWGFVPAALIGAVLFGSAHLHQGGDAAEAAGIFAVTALGGLWFAWLYVEWDFDLWVPVAFHMLMNAWWIVFPVADNALGPAWAVGVRGLVLALAVVATLARARRRGGRRLRGRAWWWGGAGAA